MRRLLSILAFVILLVPFKTAEAHLVGQPPFFKINNVYSNLYPVPTTSLNDFNLPQDLADKNYLVNQPINFEIDTNPLPVPKDIIAKSQFTWDFGDGSKGTGLKNTHTYTKMGSYILTINVQSADSSLPNLLQSVLINVLPDPNYKLPQPVLKINGQQSKDPLTDVLKFTFDKPLQLDGSDSQSNSPITSYFIDFGDGQSSTNPKATHQYSQQIHQYFPLLRIKTADGFIADTFVEIETPDQVSNSTSSGKTNNPSTPSAINYPLFIAAGLPILLLIGFLIKVKR